ncbi:MAG: low molecular weight phosphatase family protein [Bauldia sp.]|nr:low molecular weight phosphatase family protein [Bauldia sp.]
MAGGPRSLLFACKTNSVRSPIAAALARKMLPGVYVASAGVFRGEADPFAVAVMEESGLDLSIHRPLAFEDLEDGFFDIIVTLAPEAHHRAMELTRNDAVEVEYWPTFDATAVTGNREQRLAAYREVRDGLMRRIRERFGGRARPLRDPAVE